MINYLNTVLLLTALTVLLVWACKVIGGQTGMVIALVLAVLMNGISYRSSAQWYSHRNHIFLQSLHLSSPRLLWNEDKFTRISRNSFCQSRML